MANMYSVLSVTRRGIYYTSLLFGRMVIFFWSYGLKFGPLDLVLGLELGTGEILIL